MLIPQEQIIWSKQVSKMSELQLSLFLYNLFLQAFPLSLNFCCPENIREVAWRGYFVALYFFFYLFLLLLL